MNTPLPPDSASLFLVRSPGGEVKINKDVQVFSMPYFFATTSSVVCRAAAVFAFTLMLAHYIGELQNGVGWCAVLCCVVVVGGEWWWVVSGGVGWCVGWRALLCSAVWRGVTSCYTLPRNTEGWMRCWSPFSLCLTCAFSVSKFEKRYRWDTERLCSNYCDQGPTLISGILSTNRGSSKGRNRVSIPLRFSVCQRHPWTTLGKAVRSLILLTEGCVVFPA